MQTWPVNQQQLKLRHTWGGRLWKTLVAMMRSTPWKSLYDQTCGTPDILDVTTLDTIKCSLWRYQRRGAA